MKMISHQAIGVNLPIGFLASLRERFQQVLPVNVVHENILAPITAIHDVIDRARIFNSQLPGHAANQTIGAASVKRQKGTCYGLTRGSFAKMILPGRPPKSLMKSS